MLVGTGMGYGIGVKRERTFPGRFLREELLLRLERIGERAGWKLVVTDMGEGWVRGEREWVRPFLEGFLEKSLCCAWRGKGN